MFTLPQFIAEVRRLAAEKPDVKYFEHITGPYSGRCWYNATDKAPACIMGQAAANLGFPFENSDEGNVIEWVLAAKGLGKKGDVELAWLGHVQAAQDRNSSWGFAVAEADEKFPTMRVR